MMKKEMLLRKSLFQSSLLLNRKGLNHGATGNLSCRNDNGFIITPSGVSLENLDSNSMVEIGFNGEIINSKSNYKPSSEWLFHRDIYAAKDDIHAIVHTHSVFSSTLSVIGESIPPFHYMIAVAGGDSIRCSDYALFGSQELSNNIIIAMEQRKACLISNHGMIAIGKDLNEAINIAIEVEHLAQVYVQAKMIGTPKLLNDNQMLEVIDKFKNYGEWSKD
ncbi:MAG: class II aldolase/adducin family protein [Methylophilaceae bacterium]|jgi:L-fuculose-phosphate aldolase|nr:class II aldolase/adducin family protein [Methylophilaceae bacterium]